MTSEQAVGLLFTPESPVWLHWKGRRAAALYSEHQLLGSLWREEGEVEADGGAADEEEPLRPNDQVNVPSLCWSRTSSAPCPTAKPPVCGKDLYNNSVHCRHSSASEVPKQLRRRARQKACSILRWEPCRVF